ncbi:1144_t:CDS:2 [Entrophospora sp. SA101]|nr:8798_t:CDS:2 [Entrophospora sp. SA101]CAJ0837481.1 1144_t:CDS:2 [Entrophospora sp. SA101]
MLEPPIYEGYSERVKVVRTFDRAISPIRFVNEEILKLDLEKHFILSIIEKINDKYYVGQAKSLGVRLNQHFSNGELDALEKQKIEEYNSFDGGYNGTGEQFGGDDYANEPVSRFEEIEKRLEEHYVAKGKYKPGKRSSFDLTKQKLNWCYENFEDDEKFAAISPYLDKETYQDLSGFRELKNKVKKLSDEYNLSKNDDDDDTKAEEIMSEAKVKELQDKLINSANLSQDKIKDYENQLATALKEVQDKAWQIQRTQIEAKSEIQGVNQNPTSSSLD